MTDLQDCLRFFAGDWVGEEDIAASKWGAGGRASSLISARLDFDGRVLIQDYSAQRDGKAWFKAHAVIALDQSGPCLSLHWFDSMGFIPGAPASGEWDGKALRFVRSSPRGQARHTYIPSGPESYELILESSFDSGATWTPVMKGRYVKAAEAVGQ